MLKDILDFFKELATTITWPMAALIIAFMFRKQLFLAIKALTLKIETSDKITMTSKGMTLEKMAAKVEAVDKKIDETTNDVKALATTGGTGGKKAVEEIKESKQESGPGYVADDPQKNQWGGKSRAGNRELKARVTAISERLYRVELEVITTSSFNPLTGKVRFHLHPTFPNSVQDVEAVNGKAALTLISYGSFTVGAEADNGNTKLELDLEKVDGVSDEFKNA
jgi:hypothetical protein